MDRINEPLDEPQGVDVFALDDMTHRTIAGLWHVYGDLDVCSGRDEKLRAKRRGRSRLLRNVPGADHSVIDQVLAGLPDRIAAALPFADKLLRALGDAKFDDVADRRSRAERSTNQCQPDSDPKRQHHVRPSARRRCRSGALMARDDGGMPKHSAIRGCHIVLLLQIKDQKFKTTFCALYDVDFAWGSCRARSDLRRNAANFAARFGSTVHWLEPGWTRTLDTLKLDRLDDGVGPDRQGYAGNDFDAAVQVINLASHQRRVGTDRATQGNERVFGRRR